MPNIQTVTHQEPVNQDANPLLVESSTEPELKTLREILKPYDFEDYQFLAKDSDLNWHKYKTEPTYRSKGDGWDGDWDFLCDDDEDAVVAKLPQGLRDKAPKDSLVSLDSEWEV
ncbi:hypothetical protein [Microbulbifer sp. JMSA002]|uniref:hypothetical protein n=1 Tax=Microbulbifer sp. JMSA002 TaxID=3243368 RepID=UPI004039B810